MWKSFESLLECEEFFNLCQKKLSYEIMKEIVRWLEWYAKHKRM